MNLSARLTVALYLPVALVALGMLALPSLAKPTPTLPSSAGPAQSAPVPPGAVPPRWRVYCGRETAPGDCEARQSVYRRKTGQRLISVVVQIDPASRKPIMRIQLPLGIDIGSGALLQIGFDLARRVSLQSCDRRGCYVDHAISEAELAGLIKGERLRISVRDRDGVLVRYRVSGRGFAEAYSKIR